MIGPRMNTNWTFDRERLLESSNGAPRYEQIALTIEGAIERGELQAGDRLPPVRVLAGQLEVSGASVAVAYGLLARRGRVHAQVGRGTFVSSPPALDTSGGMRDPRITREAPTRISESGRTSLASSWRRRVIRFADRLGALHPEALACSASWPDLDLLPTAVLQRAFTTVAERLEPADLQYSGPEPHPALVRALLPRLAHDNVPVSAEDLLVVNSARQLLAFALRIAPGVVDSRELMVAVEEPGYHSAFDTIENLGHRIVGVDVDAHGAQPASLQAALDRGANLVLLTPRALNPTGASWTVERREALADVLARYPRALVIEDDYFAGVCGALPGSLLGDRRLEDRVIYVRSFSKSIGPDLRVAAVAARPRLRIPLRDAKVVADGWSSRIIQRALAAALEDPGLDVALEAARRTYAERRRVLTQVLEARLPDAIIVGTQDGVNVWVELPPGCDAMDVVHNAAELGVLVANGEAFYIRPGRGNAVRVSVGAIDRAEAVRAGELLASAALTVDHVPVSIVV